jgi:hypothetical protein
MTDTTDYGCHCITIDQLHTIAVSYPSPAQAEHVHVVSHRRRPPINVRTLLGGIEEVAWIHEELEAWWSREFSDNEIARGVPDIEAAYASSLYDRLHEIRCDQPEI